ncbi:LytR/AlgR family response regulator transcription factor [Adhaeribacter radiodurans]|uniref:Response regulator transcription factor n=1 Tax=Adhaeribacter radiodurans TaxID=2745197 RepID=A0A7L7L6Y9_9BACT|nr:LytTR family DNA-binding domain-containing protein [Adhaeribacter radiodurans]QMU28570.1 response regulator transcription factor [Adhaeribacter radiodurans]
MRIVIVEDEAIAARRLRKMVETLEPSCTIEATLDSVSATVNWFNSHLAPDLLLLDIELADGQSFDIFKQIEVACPIIFTTSYDEHAIRAFKLNSIDYLLKPIQEKELQQSLQKLKNLQKVFTERKPLTLQIEALLKELQEQQLPTPGQYRDRILVKQGQRMIPITSNEVAYFFTKEKINFLLTKDNRRYQIDFTMEELEKSLPPKDFFRANRQFLVNYTAVEKVSQDYNAKLKLNLNPSPAEEVIISREKAMEFRQWLGE